MIADLFTVLLWIVIVLVLGYLPGSIPFGLLITKFCGLGDIRKIGSGNIGATNVLRTGNKLLALITLLLDGGKGAFVVLLWIIFQHYAQDEATVLIITPFETLLIGLCAVLGHMFPVWLKFKGGKGVATALGVFLAATPPVGIIACITWLLTAAIFRISSLAAMVAMTMAPIAIFFMYGHEAAAIGAIISSLVIIRHGKNVERLLNGTEPKIGKKK